MAINQKGNSGKDYESRLTRSWREKSAGGHRLHFQAGREGFDSRFGFVVEKEGKVNLGKVLSRAAGHFGDRYAPVWGDRKY